MQRGIGDTTTASTQLTNLVSNPSFENGLTGWHDNNAAATLEVLPNEADRERWCMHVMDATGSRGGYVDLPTTPGVVYTFSAWAKTITGSARISAYNGGSLGGSNRATANGTWQLMAVAGTATQYFDGDSPGAAWTGTAHNSSSNGYAWTPY